MLISIVTPVLNDEANIERNLRCLASQKADFEHIIMDGGSTDGTEGIVRSFQSDHPMFWHQQRDRSLYEGVWNGMSYARGDILAWLNADDIYLDWTLATVTRVFEQNPHVEWICGIPAWYDDRNNVGRVATYAPVMPRSFVRRGWYAPDKLGHLPQADMFWRRSLWEKADCRDILLKYRLAGDYHLWKRFAAHAELHTVACVLSAFTVREGQLSGKYLGEYVRECNGDRAGVSGQPSALAMAANRIVSALLYKKVLTDPFIFRHDQQTI